MSSVAHAASQRSRHERVLLFCVFFCFITLFTHTFIFARLKSRRCRLKTFRKNSSSRSSLNDDANDAARSMTGVNGGADHRGRPSSSLFADARAMERVSRAPTLANAGYPFVRHDAADARRRRAESGGTATTAGAGAERRQDGSGTTRRSGSGGARREATTGSGRQQQQPQQRAYVRVEDVIESTRAAEDALRKNADDARAANETRAREIERERVKRYAQAQLEAEESRRALAVSKDENKGLVEENARLASELRAALSTRAPATAEETRDADEEQVDETVQELFDLVEKERREKRILEEKLVEYERRVDTTSARGVASEEAERRVEDAEATIRDQETKLSQAAEIIGELRTALLQMMETQSVASRDGVAPSEATETEVRDDGETARQNGTPLERTAAAVKMWEGKMEKLVLDTVKSTLERVMESPALQSNKAEGVQVVAAVTDAIGHELSSIVENAMSGIVDEMRFQFGQDDADAVEEMGIGGRKRFIVWLADENSRRVQLEEQLFTVQDELARSEASRQIATQRWLQAMTQIDGSVLDDESDFGEILSRLDDVSDDGTSIYSLDVGEMGSPVRRRAKSVRRPSSIVSDAPYRGAKGRIRSTDVKSETRDYANMQDVMLPSFQEEEEEDPSADVAIMATPGGSIYIALRRVMRNVVFPFLAMVTSIVVRVVKHVYACCQFCSASANFELIWPVSLLLIFFYWKIGAFGALAASVSASARVVTAPPQRLTTQILRAPPASRAPPIRLPIEHPNLGI